MVIDNSKNPLLQLVKTGKGGENFYSYIDPLTISTPRGLAALKAKRFADMNITERSLRELIREIKSEAGAGDIVKAFSIVQEIEFRLTLICEESSLLDLACIYFFLQDEDPENPSDAMNRKKHAIFNSDQEIKGFFLRIALSILKKSSEKPEEDSLNYIQDSQAIAERIRRFIPEEHLITSISG